MLRIKNSEESPVADNTIEIFNLDLIRDIERIIRLKGVLFSKTIVLVNH